jgi:anaerobic selenocysteine-containing dehydrogenase
MMAYQIFGSEELSAKSVNIQNRMTESYVAIAPEDAETLSLDQGDRVSLGDPSNTAIACIRTKIKTGTAAVYFGDNELDRHSLAKTLVLSKAGGGFSGNALNGLIVSDLLEQSY